MDRHTARAVILEIPTSTLGEVQSDSEIWEGNDGGAHFKMTRHELPIEGSGLDIFSLSISGEASERDRLATEFIEILGDPENIHTEAGDQDQQIDFLTWLVRRDAVR